MQTWWFHFRNNVVKPKPDKSCNETNLEQVILTTLGSIQLCLKKIVFWWETKSKDSLSTAAAAGGIRFKSSVSVFLFPPVCFGRDLCFGLNCQSANKQGHGGWVTGSKTSKLHKHWTKLAATFLSPFSAFSKWWYCLMETEL